MIPQNSKFWSAWTWMGWKFYRYWPYLLVIGAGIGLYVYLRGFWR